MRYRFAIYGIEEGEYEGELTLDNLQRLADMTYQVTGHPVRELVTNHKTRRELIRIFNNSDLISPLDEVRIVADRVFPHDLVCAKVD